ncbi:MAG: hypothetical protein ACO3C1_00470 [Ilumatobacteraceae bacterium]
MDTLVAPPSAAAFGVTTPPPPPRTIQVASRRIPVVLPRLEDSRLHVAAVVITLHTLGQVALGFHVSVPQILTAILTCALLQVVITFRQTGSIVWPASAMLTGSGIGLILRVPTTPVGDHWTFHKWWVFAGIAAFSLLTKYVIRWRGTHVFNPSNLGLVLAFIVLGSSVIEPLDFWWAPLSNPGMLAAYAVILVGGSLVARRLHLLATVVSFWVVLAVGTAINAASGQCFTARWAFAPVCGAHLWRTIVTSPETMIFTYFMITDPRTVPKGRVGRSLFGALVGVVCVLLMAPQQTEFGAKVALLSGLTVMTLVRPLLERYLPSAGSVGDTLRAYARRMLTGPTDAPTMGMVATRAAAFSSVALLLVGGLAVGGRSAQGLLAGAPESTLDRMTANVDPSTFPDITVDQEVIDWNHEIDVDGAREIVLTMAQNLQLETTALLNGDDEMFTAVAHGDRLDWLRTQLAGAQRTGTTVVNRYDIDTVRVTLLVPFGRQDGLSLGMVSRGTVTTERYSSDGALVSTQSSPFETMWAMRRATGARWLVVAELPVPPRS